MDTTLRTLLEELTASFHQSQTEADTEDSLGESSLYAFNANPEEKDFAHAMSAQVQALTDAASNAATAAQKLAAAIDSIDELRKVLPNNETWDRFRSVLSANSKALVKDFRSLEKLADDLKRSIRPIASLKSILRG